MALTPIKAIKAHCKDCSGDSRKEVTFCNIPECPLYDYRLGKNPRRQKIGLKGLLTNNFAEGDECMGSRELSGEIPSQLPSYHKGIDCRGTN